MNERVFKGDAKSATDTLFDTKIFREDITRDQMNAFEDLIALLLQQRYEGYLKAEELRKSIQKLK